MDNMFELCWGLTIIDLSSFSFENVITMKYMFSDCSDLIEIKFNNNTLTKNLEMMDNMFEGCESLKYLDTKIFKVNKVKNLNYVFSRCH